MYRRIEPILCTAIILMIRAYRFLLSPWLGQQCRFHPTCSAYAIEALRCHGPVRGTWLALRRLACCHPWHEGGVDPVPERKARG